MRKGKTLVLDSSVVVKWLNRREEKHLAAADKILERLVRGGLSVSVPSLAKFEIGNALLRGKQLTVVEAAEALEVFGQIPLSYYDGDRETMVRAYELGFERKITFYDAYFLALAEELSATLVTDNPRHQTKLAGIKVVPLKNYR